MAIVDDLQLSQASFAYPGYDPLWSGLSATWKAPGWHALIGPNGSGKSTLLKLMAGWMPWQQGQLQCRESLLGLPPERRPLLLLPSLPDLLGQATLLHHLNLVEKWCGTSGKALPLLKQLKLESKAGLPAQQLSQGQRQLAGWARALLRAPTWILADESWQHLDGASRLLLQQVLRESGINLLCVTHQLQADLPLCDSLWCLRAGKLSELDLQTLWQQPKHLWLAQQLQSDWVWTGPELGCAEGHWWLPDWAWQPDSQGLEVEFIEPRGPGWLVQLGQRRLLLPLQQPCSRLGWREGSLAPLA